MTDSFQTQTPSKGSRQAKYSSGSDNQKASRRGGRRGGPGGGQAAQKQPQSINSAQATTGTFDENGRFIDNADTTQPQSGQRGRSKRGVVAAETPRSIVGVIEESPVTTHSPFAGTPPKQYYAGPAFHQSPAASALPMPRFLSKSVPKAGLSAPSLLEHAGHDTAGDTSSSNTTPEPSPSMGQARPNVNLPSRPIESPLDKLFQAARAEKAGSTHAAGRQSSNSPIPTPANSAPAPAPAPANHWTSIYGGRPNHQRTVSSDSNRGLFTMDLDSGSQNPAQSPGKAAVAGPLGLSRTVSDGLQHAQQRGQGNQVYKAPETFAAAHSSPGPSLESSVPGASQAASQQPNARSPVALRNAQTTPVHQQSSANVQSQTLHYGNRNLSPMFQAARTNSPRSQSSLRHQVDLGQAPYYGDSAGGLPDRAHQGFPPQHAATSTSRGHSEQMTDRSNVYSRDSQGNMLRDSQRDLTGSPHTESDNAKMQALSDNLRNLLKIQKHDS